MVLARYLYLQPLHRPSDGQLRIIPPDGLLMSLGAIVCRFVEEVHTVTQHQESVCKA